MNLGHENLSAEGAPWARLYETALRAARLFIVATIVVFAPARAQEAAAWPDTYVGRLQALALLQTINAEVLASPSATLTLEAWCRDHHLASESTITAEVVRDVAKAPTAEQRQRLRVSPQDEVKYRKVRL